MPRTQIALLLAAAAAVVLLATRYAGASDPPAPAAPPVRVESAPPVMALVHVAGEVRRPGVYRLKPGARIDDAVQQAGGATDRADLSAVNLAAKVEDGRQVLVPERAPRAARAAAAGAASPITPGGPLNLNTATLEQLDTLTGVGPATAQKILDFRQERGGFGSVDELAQIPGIGDKRLASLKEQVRV